MSKTHRLNHRREVRKKVVRKWRNSNCHSWFNYEDGCQHRIQVLRVENETPE